MTIRRTRQKVAGPGVRQFTPDPIPVSSFNAPGRNGDLKLVHELQVHQIELEQQYAELQDAHNEADSARSKYRVLYDSAPIGLCTIAVNGRLEEINATGATLLGASPSHLIARRLQTFLVSDSVSALNRCLESAALGQLPLTCELHIANPARSIQFLIDSPTEDETGARNLRATMTDLTPLRRVERKLQESEERFRQLTENIDLIFFIEDVERHMMLYVSPSFERVFGVLRGSLFKDSRAYCRVIHPGDLAREEESYRKRERHESADIEYRIRPDDGPVRWVRTRTFAASNGDERLVYGVVEDITDHKVGEERLAYLAQYDALTGLPSRNLLLDRLTQAIADACRAGQRLAVLFMDLDQFKLINDTLGHDGGDRVLQAVAERLRSVIRASDTVARLGGDEFVIITPGIAHGQEAAAVVHKVMRALSEPLEVEGHELFLGASVGISMFPDDGQDPTTLVKAADSAMYHAKECGRNNFQYYSPDLTTRALEVLAKANGLRHALECEELTLHYQPRVSLSQGRITTAEALLRWNVNGGVLAACDFIDIAEQTGVVVSIGDWVLQTACNEVNRWSTMGFPDMRVAVNVSGRQFRNPHLPNAVARAIADSGIDPQQLEIEITESVLIRDTRESQTVLSRLRDMGVRVAIDDFGTGYSSLAYLKSFAIEALKIDRSFVRDIETDPNDQAICRAIIAMAKGLHLRVIAEGVETNEQLEFLDRCGCDEVQGYFLGRPVPADRFVEGMAENRIGTI